MKRILKVGDTFRHLATQGIYEIRLIEDEEVVMKDPATHALYIVGIQNLPVYYELVEERNDHGI